MVAKYTYHTESRSVVAVNVLLLHDVDEGC